MEQQSSLVEYGFRRVLITLIVIICTTTSVMNLSALNVAFSDIRGNMGISINEVTWVATVYAFACILIMPISSWLSRQLGRRNCFAIAVILLTVSSFLCGNAEDIQQLVIFRFLQGLAGGGMLALSHSIITESWPIEKRATSQVFFIMGFLWRIQIRPTFDLYRTGLQPDVFN